MDSLRVNPIVKIIGGNTDLDAAGLCHGLDCQLPSMIFAFVHINVSHGSADR
jgi:hypothetical protein